MLAQEISLSRVPDRMIMRTSMEDIVLHEMLANNAIDLARSRMPKVTGRAANSILPVYGDNHFGIYFPDKTVWYLERGTQARTMHSLAGKVIPMWIDDPSGQERKKDPKAKTRMTLDGRVQVLIFRRAAGKGTRKNVQRRGRVVSVPRSYPGAPGRIGRREASQPHTMPGRVAGQIAQQNSGVRWRNPGITGKSFMNSAIAETAMEWGIELAPVYLVDSATYSTASQGR